ncbi:MAG: glycoside hydrolase family 88 protein [Vallitalea sp.]|jgi:unsaturated chondroitin disaccharide hydrolase|nr:glycoside hydrolase family 88 protein [Vallitalea sp.]
MNKVIDEGIKNINRYESKPNLTKNDIKKAIDHVLAKIDQNLDKYTNKFPTASSKDLVYGELDNVDWTASFFTGMLWLAYEVTEDEKYKNVAKIHIQSFKERLEKRIQLDHHDLGFLYTLSCVSSYKITGDEESKEIALEAAKLLASRYYDKAEIIQAWGDLSDPTQRGRMIIDCNMNLPLLYWASDVTGDSSYKDMATKHIAQASKYLIREDASSFHTYYMDTKTGEPLYGNTKQGYSDDSCWARGQAWGIYGFPLSYSYIKDWNLIELTKKVTNYYLNRLPEDSICYWDLIFTEKDNEERDSSAAAIAVCGLLELIKYLPVTDEYYEYYKNASQMMLKSLITDYTTDINSDANGLLLHGVYYKGGDCGVDESCIFGDYYYFEALVRAYKDWNKYW